MDAVKRHLARAYCDDARHFLLRYRSLRPQDFNKAGRIKNFVDVCMAAECAIKATVFASNASMTACDAYKSVKGTRGGHCLGELLKLVAGQRYRPSCEALSERLGHLHVSLRYSVDAWEWLFQGPDRSDDRFVQYRTTISNIDWCNETLRMVEQLLDELQPDLVTTHHAPPISELLAYQVQWRQFVECSGFGGKRASANDDRSKCEQVATTVPAPQPREM
jgi:hypothetical protein